MSFSAFAAALTEGNGEVNIAGTVEGGSSSAPENNTAIPPSGSVGEGSDWPNVTSSITNVSIVSSVFGAGIWPSSHLHHHCGVGGSGSGWAPANHVYFQLANAFFFLSYLAPHRGAYGILYLRVTLLVGCAFFALWGWAVLCSFDAFLWNAAFVAINLLHVCVLLFHLRPVKFTREVEEVYLALFQPLKVTRHQFKKVLDCMKGIRHLKYQEVYAQEKVTKVESLSLVLSGKLVVSQNGRALHIVFPHQFLDSPEWFGVSTDEFFQVSITAMEESRVLIWHRDKLKLTIITDQFLQAVFDHILGRDVVKKLMQMPVVGSSCDEDFAVLVSETMAASNNGHLPNSLEDGEDKPMLIVKKAGDGPGITALINRQLQGMPRIRYYYCATDPNAWRLGRIEEADHETPV
ncbi:popeye domain-containing protein 1 isoform X1 [Hetaerina americana]|uniref:popeye domain-containing protein 1 isoform X1 n=1 Tax=Hetaerina americana TaxID=62018 RepID=UPI003A7F26F3